MQPSDYNQLLVNQINGTIGDMADVPIQFQRLLQQINASYDKFDENQKLIKKQVELRTAQLITSTSNAYSFLDSLNMGFIMCDVNSEVVLANMSVRNMLYSKTSSNEDSRLPQSVEQTWTLDAIDELLQPELQLKKLVPQCLESSKPIEIKEVDCGKHVLHLFIAPMINEVSEGNKQQIGAVILIEDITEQKVLERSKDEFLSIASHELRTPLTAIRGNASLIKKYYGDKLPDGDVVEMIDDIHESSIRLIEIVNDFLDVSAIEQGKIIMNAETFSLVEVIGEVIRDLQGLCDLKGITLENQSNVEAALSIKADKQRVEQVIYNLVGNAIKFTDNGGISITTKADEKFVYTLVTDTGKGISIENQRLLFRKFQQAGNSLLTRDSTKGTGLGLYISKLIVELSGGKISLESSELGKGSSFIFGLPRFFVK
ncbi:MAG: HAMP domain-containing sensor histidine kinase [Candidatus Saccharibacteria bacterium]